MRLISVIPLTALAWFMNTFLFLIIYLFAILTDVFDGWIARKQGLASAKGAAFDGSVDLVFAAFGLVWLYSFTPELYVSYAPHLLVVAGMFMLFFAVSVIKLGTLAMPHLWLGKLSMALFSVMVPLMILFGVHAWMVWSVVVVVILSRLEMIAFVLSGRKDMDARSIFF